MPSRPNGFDNSWDWAAIGLVLPGLTGGDINSNPGNHGEEL